MSQQAMWEYSEVEGNQHVSLEYQNRKFCMDLILPKARDGLAKLVRQKNFYFGSMEGLAKHMVDLKLPKFEFRDRQDLTGVLAKMGLKHGFATGAFPVIAEEAYLSKLAQETYINVDEKGTEAAAVTITEATMGIANSEPPKPIKVVFDRPFFFAIREQRSGLILFLGTVWTLPEAR